MTAVAVFLDLDGTIIHPLQSFPVGAAVEIIEPTPSGATAIGLDAVRALERLAEVAVVVPATTRSAAQYARVEKCLPRRSGWASVSNGARILTPDGEDETWRAAQRGRAGRWCAETLGVEGMEGLAEVLATGSAGEPVRVTPVDDVFVVAVAADVACAERVRRHFADTHPALRSSLTRQGRKVYVIPPVISKEGACAEIARRLGARWSAAAGDSELDAGMLREADLGITLTSTALDRADPGDAPAPWSVVPGAGPDGTVGLLRRIAHVAQERGAR